MDEGKGENIGYTIGSLFDGSGGFPLAASLCGIEPVWASEVEPYPIAVTRSRFPTMKHLGDISKINGAEIEPVDIITFGSPCQDLSVAGKRAGLEGARSGLFMEAVRIIKEMRSATNGKYPTFALWENVPGAFSSNKGEDFRIVLEELIKVSEPSAVMPQVPEKGWAYADSYSGDGWSLAYRVFDAQYWGVPQRRRRIHLVADFGGQRARKILFEREGVRGHLEESEPQGKETAGDAGAGSGVHHRDGAAEWGTINLNNMEAQKVYFLQGNGIDRADTAGCNGNEWNGKTCYTLNTIDRPTVAYLGSGDDVIGTLCAGAAIRGFSGGQEIYTGNYHVIEERSEHPRYIVRRLTPTECARLQGFQDDWGRIEEKDSFTPEEYEFWLEVRNTHAAINGRAVKDYTEKQMLTWYNKLHTDSAEYKMWGNGIALPPALYCMQGISEMLAKEEDDAWMN